MEISLKQTKALAYYNNGFNCAQSVVAVFADDFSIDKDLLLKLATGLGAGMAKTQRTCGAVSGSLMVMGLEYGTASNETDYKKENTYVQSKIFLNSFEQENGSLNCKELLQGNDFNTEAGQIAIYEADLFETVCNKCVLSAVGIIEKMIG